jgi:hypothetical protein
MFIHHSKDAFFFLALKRYMTVMPSTDRKLELKAKTSVAQTASQAAVYAKGLRKEKALLICSFVSADVSLLIGAEILLTVSGVPLSGTDSEAHHTVDQSAIAGQMELQVQGDIQGDEVTAGEKFC